MSKCVYNMKNIMPNLVEPNIRKYVSGALEKCHTNRVVVYYWVLNVGVVIIIGLIVAMFVYYSMTKKLSPVEYRNKLVKDHEAVLKQINVYKEEHNRIQNFTGLSTIISKHRGQDETPMREVLLPTRS